MNNVCRPVKAITVITAVFMISACGKSPLHDDYATSGLVYYLPKSQLVVDIKSDYKTSTFVNSNLEIETKSTRDALIVNLNKQDVADTSRRYFLDMPSSFFSQTKKFSVTVDEKGFLKGVNATSTGEAGAGIQSIANIVSTALPVIGMLGEPEGNGKKAIEAMEENGLITSAEKAALFAEEHVMQRYVLDDVLGRERWRERFSLGEEVKSSQKKAAALSEQKKTETQPSVIQELDRQIEALAAQVKNLSEQRETLTTVLDSGLSLYKSKHNIGDKPSSFKFSQVLELAEVPVSDKIKAGMLRDEVNAVMKEDFQCDNQSCPEYGKIWDIWTKFDIIVTMDPYNAVKEQWQASSKPSGSSNDLVIYLRQPIQQRISMYQIEKSPDFGLQVADTEDHKERLNLAKCGEKDKCGDLYELYNPLLPPTIIAFDKSAFSERNLSVKFDNGGVTLGREDIGASSFASLANSIENAASGSIKNYKDTLGVIKEAEANKNAIRIARLQHEVDTLEKEKEIINAEIARDGASASKDIQVKKLIIVEKIALREKELGELEANLKYDKLDKTYGLQLATEISDKTADKIASALKVDKAESTYDLLLETAVLDALKGKLTTNLEVDKLGSTYSTELNTAILKALLENINAETEVDTESSTQYYEVLAAQLKANTEYLEQKMKLMQKEQELKEKEKELNEKEKNE